MSEKDGIEVAPLGEYYTEDEQAAHIMNLSQNLARRRYEDFDDTVKGYNFTEEDNQRIMSGDFDPAEAQYAIAKEGSSLSVEELFDENKSLDLPEPDPDSPEAIYGE